MLEVNKETFEAEVLNAEGYVLVDFWGKSCEPCKALLPHVEELAEKYGDKMKFCKLDTSSARRLAIKQRVLGLPTIAIYKDGEKIDELTKEDATPANIEEMIKKYV
ncbi:thioredoxin [Caloranaerobacter sp. TR13]|uniref:thioredoxin TrxA n=1 Tax=Caloranaerobacter sp. TR13 TaxID=1302151 RepID=UPI0006D47D39|nr:thioredoxin family protein [Caloranaerobacter sp. TR13]KPU27071.1 thioredoxin [Caloranaerobacter sp. TR13]